MHVCILSMTGCRKWIYRGQRATLIYPVTVLRWWDVKAYCQVIFILFLSALFDSSQYVFATYDRDSWAWEQQVASKGGIIIRYSSLSWIQLCKRCLGVKLKIVNSKNDFLSWRVSFQLWWGHTLVIRGELLFHVRHGMVLSKGHASTC